MTEHSIRAAIEQAVRRSDYWDNSSLHENQKAALDAYFGRHRPAYVDGRSNALSMDVADMVEAVTAQINPAFGFDEIAAFDPDGPDDVEQCQHESSICNRYLQINRSKIEIQGAIRNALLLRNGITKTWVEEREDAQREDYTALTAIELASVQEPQHPDQTVRVTSIAQNDEDSELTDITLIRTTKLRKLTVENIDPTNFIIEREYGSIYMDTANLVGERRFYTRSQLIGMGYDRKLIEGIPATTTDTKVASLSRNRDVTPPDWQRQDPAGERIEVFELYMRLDVDRDGIAELRRIIYTGVSINTGIILENEYWPFQPYAAGTPLLFPNRWLGVSLFDKLQEIADIKTRGLRQWEDNLNNANFNEVVFNDDNVNPVDMKARRPGGGIRTEGIPANDVMQLMPMNTGDSSQMFMNFMDKTRSERGGAALDMQQAQFQIAGESAHGIERQYSVKEQLAQLMCETLGETLIRETFRRIHQTLRTFMPNAADFQAGSEFISAAPGTWPARFEVTVLAGMSNSQRAERRHATETVLLQQEKLHEAGMDGILMDLTTYHAALLDWSKAGGITTPRRYWIDPRSDRARMAAQEKQRVAEQERQRLERQQGMLFATQLAIADRNNSSDLFKHVSQLRFDYWKQTLESEVEQYKIEMGSDPTELNADQETGRARSEQQS